MYCLDNCVDNSDGFITIAESNKRTETVLNKLDEIITEQLDQSDNQVECQTLRWVLDKISELI